jgi:hypothetical protein
MLFLVEESMCFAYARVFGPTYSLARTRGDQRAARKP